MPCTDPRTVGFKADGKTLSWSQKDYSKEFATFKLPCGQCLECRLSQAREKAVRCVHEASMYEKNAFITLTYDDEHLKSSKLIYEDWQNFAQRLRDNAPLDPITFERPKIPIMVTGEYGNDVDQFGNPRPRVIHPIHGDVTKRPHWHAIVFNWTPSDGVYKYTSDRGDRVFSSEQLTALWGNGTAEYGSVTIESAGYVARYATKKLVHGKDGEHDFEPIHKMSSKYAIGKRWLEKYWPDIFLQGHCVLEDGSKVPIPRYYEKWLKEHRPSDWLCYVEKLKLQRQNEAEAREKTEEQKWWDVYNARRLTSKTPLRRNEVRRLIKNKQFEQLQAYLKL